VTREGPKSKVVALIEQRMRDERILLHGNKDEEIEAILGDEVDKLDRLADVTIASILTHDDTLIELMGLEESTEEDSRLSNNTRHLYIRSRRVQVDKLEAMLTNWRAQVCCRTN
jgi:hypothetical protein